MISWLRESSRDFKLFLIAGCLVGFAGSLVDSIFNNFLSDTFHLAGMQRTMLEVPREVPGLLVVFVSGLLFFLCSRRVAALANLIAFIGIVLIGFFSNSYSITLIWLFIYSCGQHLFMPLVSSIGMELANGKNHGKVLGNLQGASNLAAIVGAAVVFIGFSQFHFTFITTFIIAGAGLLCASVLLFLMKPDKPVSMKTRFRLRREYRLFYLLAILFGTRKQIFITFAPWVLVTVFEQKVQVIATLLTVGGVVGIIFKPLLGRAIDRFGERTILAGEAVILVFVCIGYGFSNLVFPGVIGLGIVFACYITDQLLMSVGMARAMYLRRIAVDPQEITSTLTMGVSIDHIFSISIAVVSGLVWASLGYRYVFLIGAVIALLNLFAALRIKPRNSLSV